MSQPENVPFGSTSYLTVLSLPTTIWWNVSQKLIGMYENFICPETKLFETFSSQIFHPPYVIKRDDIWNFWNSFLCIWKSRWCFSIQSKFDWPFNCNCLLIGWYSKIMRQQLWTRTCTLPNSAMEYWCPRGFTPPSTPERLDEKNMF